MQARFKQKRLLWPASVSSLDRTALQVDRLSPQADPTP